MSLVASSSSSLSSSASYSMSGPMEPAASFSSLSSSALPPPLPSMPPPLPPMNPTTEESAEKVSKLKDTWFGLGHWDTFEVSDETDGDSCFISFLNFCKKPMQALIGGHHYTQVKADEGYIETTDKNGKKVWERKGYFDPDSDTGIAETPGMNKVLAVLLVAFTTLIEPILDLIASLFITEYHNKRIAANCMIFAEQNEITTQTLDFDPKPKTTALKA